jgi:hypothetical protein
MRLLDYTEGFGRSYLTEHKKKRNSALELNGSVSTGFPQKLTFPRLHLVIGFT